MVRRCYFQSYHITIMDDRHIDLILYKPSEAEIAHIGHYCKAFESINDLVLTLLTFPGEINHCDIKAELDNVMFSFLRQGTFIR